jgi:5-methylcytosine-specific restriction protein A
MKEAAQIVFRRLTAADFYNINKPKGSEARGGGQSYIDFPTSAIRAADWAKFFAGIKATNAYSGPLWEFTVSSIGVGKSQTAEIGQRREASYNIRSQKLGTKLSNRLFAWHPKYGGFPEPANPNKRAAIPNLVIYLIRTTGGEFWAGWFQAAAPQPGWAVDNRLRPMFTREDGNIYLSPAVHFEEGDGNWPFQIDAPVVAAGSGVTPPKSATVIPTGPAVPGPSSQPLITPAAVTRKQSPRYRQKTEEQVVEELFSNDLSPETTRETWKIVRNVLKRNEKAVDPLKQLYGGECQLTGKKYVFKKTDGRLYCEAHHLRPVGEGGADSPHNLIIVSPLIHRMFHYADVTGLDLSRIVDNKLEIKINDEPFTITWHPKHAECVIAAAKNAEKRT